MTTIKQATKAYVTIYTHSGAVLPLFGQNARALTIACQTSKALGAPSGSFSVTVKSNNDLHRLIEGDDWIDIVFVTGDTEHLVMRGLVDTIQLDEASSESAITRTWTIAGRDFGKILEDTVIYYDVVNDHSLPGMFLWRVVSTFALQNAPSVLTNPFQTVQLLALGTLLDQVQFKRALWKLPPGLNARTAAGLSTTLQLRSSNQSIPGPSLANTQPDAFIRHLDFDLSTDTWPPRIATVLAPSYQPNGITLWELISHWSDPALCEMWADIGTTEGYVKGPVTPASAVMRLFHRARPFPSSTFRDANSLLPLDIEDSPYYKEIAQHSVPDSHIIRRTLQSNARHRLNAFYASSQLMGQQNEMSAINLLFMPLWNQTSIEQYGLRRFDITTNYMYDTTTAVTSDTWVDNALMGGHYKYRLRDHHCLNHLMQNGTITCRVGRPEIHVGSRVTFDSGADAYVETVSHSWTPTGGLLTNLGITRYWNTADLGQYPTMLLLEQGSYNDADLRAASGTALASRGP